MPEIREVFDQGKHPYTKDLIRSIPKSGERGGKLVTIPGTPPDLRMKIDGCPYAPDVLMPMNFAEQKNRFWRAYLIPISLHVIKSIRYR